MPKLRSNRMLTEYAVQHVLKYVGAQKPEPNEYNYLNTQVRVNEDLSLVVSLFGRSILFIDRTESDDIDKVYVFTGDFYDRDGNPSDTTRERLNGLLAALGDACVIPKRVRVFMQPYSPEEQDYRLCYLGSGEEKILFNKDYATIVGIDASANRFMFEDRSHDAGNLG